MEPWPSAPVHRGHLDLTSCDAVTSRQAPRLPQLQQPARGDGPGVRFDFDDVEATTGRVPARGGDRREGLSPPPRGGRTVLVTTAPPNCGDTPVPQLPAERSYTSRAPSSAEAGLDSPSFPRSPSSCPQAWDASGSSRLPGLLSRPGRCLSSSSRTHAVTWSATSNRGRAPCTGSPSSGEQDGPGATSCPPLRPRMPVNGQGEVAGVENLRDCMRRQRGTRQRRMAPSAVRDKTLGAVVAPSRARQKMGKRLHEGEVREDVPRYCDESCRGLRHPDALPAPSPSTA